MWWRAGAAMGGQGPPESPTLSRQHMGRVLVTLTVVVDVHMSAVERGFPTAEIVPVPMLLGRSVVLKETM